MRDPGPPKWMLILDDDAMSRELLTVLLQREGFLVEAEDSGDAGLLSLEKRNRTAPACVLMDLHMPGISGEDLTRQLRQLCGHQTLLLAMSGSAPPPHALNQFDGFLLKPFSVEQFLSEMAEEHAVAARI